MEINIIKTLESCIITLGAMRPRVDQPEISDAARAVIRALDDCRTATQHLLQIMDDMEKKLDGAENAEDAGIDSAQVSQAAAEKEDG